jgi:hypothetical protein
MSATPESHKFTPEHWSRAIGRTLKWVAYICAAIIAAALALVWYGQLDVAGYFPHDRTLDVYMSSNWMVGENRVCWLIQEYDANQKPTGKLDSLQCPFGDEKLEPHNLTVTFKGIVTPMDTNGNPRKIPNEWRCTRGGDNFACTPVATPGTAPTP